MSRVVDRGMLAPVFMQMRMPMKKDIESGTVTCADLDVIHRLLERCDLPTEGAGECFVNDAAITVTVRVDGDLVAVAGVERHGQYGLLRSVAVAPQFRGQGLARTLCEGCVTQSRAAGIRTMYLLTETAAEIFAAFGYRDVSRDEVPAQIRASDEFRVICPSTALAMMRDLG
jgi:amino-acid N-acetyltransferase